MSILKQLFWIIVNQLTVDENVAPMRNNFINLKTNDTSEAHPSIHPSTLIATEHESEQMRKTVKRGTGRKGDSNNTITVL